MLTWKSPSGKNFVDEAACLARDELDVRLVVPAKFHAGLAEALMEACGRYGLDSAVLEGDLAVLFRGSNPCESLPPAPVLIGGEDVFDGISCEEKPWTMISIAEPGAQDADGCETLCWWGRTRDFDIPFLVENEFASLDWPALLWHKATAIALCEGDMDMIGDTVEWAPSDPREFAEFLMERPEYSEESAALVKGLYRSGKRLSFLKPPENGHAFQLWKKGLLDISQDRRPIIHRAAMFAGGMIRELHQKIIESQSLVYSPLLSETHSLICRRMDAKIGASWENREKDPENQRHRHELSPLLSYLQRHFPEAAEREIEAAKAWADIRHCVAHCNFTPPLLALKGCLAYDRLRVI